MSLLDQSADLAKSGLAPYAGDEHLNGTHLQKGSGKDLIPCLLLNRQALPGYGCLADRGNARDNLAIHSNPLSGPDKKHIPCSNLLQAHCQISALSAHGNAIGQETG